MRRLEKGRTQEGGLMESRIMKLESATGVPIRIMPGHYSTNHSHINFYVDTTALKARQSEAEQAAKALAARYVYDTVVDTIVCIEGTNVIGAFLAQQLSEAGVMSMNAHKTIYVTEPEYDNNGQLIFRDNIRPMIAGKNIIVLLADVTTGRTTARCVEAIQYYGGIVRGVCALFSVVPQIKEFPVNAVFTDKDIPDYKAYPAMECPYCRSGIPLDALVNSYGYSKLR